MTNTKSSWTMVPVSQVCVSGLHYMEVIHREGTWGSTFFGYVDPSQYSPSRRGSGMVNWRAAVSPSNSEIMFGQHLAPGDRLGMLVDVDKGRCYFFQHSSLWGYVPFGSPPITLPQTLSPMFGSKGRGDCIEIVPEHFSIANPQLPLLLESLHDVVHIVRCFEQTSCGTLSEDFVPNKKLMRSVYDEWATWLSQSTKLHLARPGVFLQFDITPKTCQQHLDSHGQPLGYGDLVQTPSGRGVIVGVFGGDPWFELNRDVNVSHEINQNTVEGAWYVYQSTANRALTIVRKNPTPPTAMEPKISFEAFQAILTTPQPAWHKVDEALIAIVNSLNGPSFNLEPSLLVDSLRHHLKIPAEQQLFSSSSSPSLLDYAMVRYGLLRKFNLSLQFALPLINFSSSFHNPAVQVSYLASLLCKHRHLIFMDIKSKYLEEMLQATATPVREPDDDLNFPSSLRMIKVSRRQALECADSGDMSERVKRSFFGQTVAAFPSRSTDMLSLRSQWVQRGHRGQKRSFVVEFLGEGVADYGGPYRELFTVCIQEIQSSLLPFLIPTRNSATRSGEDQHLWTFNPSERSRTALKYYFVLGQLVAIALRSEIELNLSLPRLVWKRLVGLEPSREDIVQIDSAATRILQLADIATEEEFARTYLEWNVHLSDGSICNLPAPTDNEFVDLKHRDLFMQMWFDARIKEAAVQINHFVSGFGSVVPLSSLKTFTPEQLEAKICGSSIDIEAFANNTVYEHGLTPETPVVQYFWQVLKELPHDQQTQFVQFALARSRLPVSPRWPVPFRIHPMKRHEVADEDPFCITVSTCFNTMTLPAYSSKQVLKEKLLLSITCKTMNLDDRLSTPW